MVPLSSAAPPSSQEMRLISLCPAIHASGLELLLSAGDFHWDGGQYSGRHTERLSGPRAADWMKGRSNTVCKASPDCSPALSVCVCVCVCVCLLGRIDAWGGQMALSFSVGAGVRFHCAPMGQHILAYRSPTHTHCHTHTHTHTHTHHP